MERRGPDLFGVMGQPSDFIGRETELAQLDELLRCAVATQAPQLVTLLGNQGTGKSRLFAEWLARASMRSDAVRIFCGRAAAHGPEYGIFGGFLRERFALQEAQEPSHQAMQVRADLAELFGDRRVAEVLHFLGTFLGVSARETPFLRAVADNPLQRDQIARSVLRRFLEVDAARSPLILGFEDLQWADPRSVSLVQELADGLAGSPVVLVAVARPELFVRYPRWGAVESEHRRIELRPFDPAQAEEMVRNLLGRADRIPDGLVAEAVEMTGGNPFFIEQLVRLFFENGTITTSAEGQWQIDAARAQTTELPMTVEEAVEARIAALSPVERDVLEKGASLGNVFWMGALVVLSRLGSEPSSDDGDFAADNMPEQIDRLLAGLTERDYLLRMPDSSIAGDAEYCFKHNLECELLAKTTDSERSREYHLLAAQWLEMKLGERREEQLEFLGQLYEAGGNTRRAAYLYISAGDKARARYANEAALGYYERGIKLLGFDDSLTKIEALHNLGAVCALIGDSERALEHFQAMLEQAWRLDHKGKGGAAHGRIGRLYRQQGEFERARLHFDRAQALFAQVGDRRGMAGTLDDIGKIYWLRGEYERALELCRQALALRREVGDARSIALSLSNIGRVHQDSGAFRAALECFDEALEIRREIRDKPGEIRSLWDLGRVYEALGELARAYGLYEQALGIATEIGDRMAQAYLHSNMGQAKTKLGAAEAAAVHLEQAVEIAQSLGDRLLLSECSRTLGETCLLLGDVDGAREHCRTALELAERIGSRSHHGAALRALAQAMAVPAVGEHGPRSEAAELFERALEQLADVGHELELARCYLAYAKFSEQAADTNDGGDKVASLRSRAAEIEGRLRGAAQASRSLHWIELEEADPTSEARV